MIASIQRISEILPHENADSLELARVLGWQVVVRKGEFKVGDFCVYVEIDSVLPEKPEFEFLRNKGFRIKTCKLRGQISQGICFPLSILPGSVTNIREGVDVTDVVGAKHWEKPVNFVPFEALGDFPTHLVPKTDEEKLKNYPELMRELSGLDVYFSAKYDGMSSSFIFHNGEFMMCSRNLKLKEIPGSKFQTVCEKYDIKNKLTSFGKNIAIQGEICGPSIQGNKMGLKELDFFVFNVYDIDDRRYFNYDELINICEILKLKIVNQVWRGNFDHFRSIEEIQTVVNELTYPNNSLAEGVVIRPIKETYSEVLRGRLSCKVISEKFLLKYNE